MQLLRLATLLISIALLVVTGILTRARQQPLTDWLLLWETGLGESNLYRLSLEGHAPEPILGISHGQNFSPWFREIDGHLYFEATDSQESTHLYRASLNGTQHQQLTPQNATFMLFSADAQWIYYTLERDDFALFRSRLDGSQREVVTQSAEVVNCQAAATGEWLACDSSAENAGHIYVMRPDGSDFHPLIAETEPRSALYGHISYLVGWSPDGQWLLFWANRGQSNRVTLYRSRPDGSEMRALTGSANFQFTTWSPDGQWVYFLNRSSLSFAALMRIEVNGAARPQSLADNYAVGLPITFLDGWLYVTVRHTRDQIDLLRIDEESRELQQLTNLPGGEQFVALSPDGKWLYFSAEVDSELLRLHLDSMQVEELIRSPGWEQTGFWSPDGQWLLYRLTTYASNQEALMAMRADGSQAELLYTAPRFTRLSEAVIWSAPPDLQWHALWLVQVGSILLAGAWVWRRVRMTTAG